MALIDCPDCAKQISDAAPACPNCGRPISGGQAAQAAPTVIEQTSKSTKALKLFGVLIMLVGFILFGASVPAGAVVTFIGVVLAIAGSAGAWWHHG